MTRLDPFADHKLTDLFSAMLDVRENPLRIPSTVIS
jgi:hypothetical protein